MKLSTFALPFGIAVLTMHVEKRVLFNCKPNSDFFSQLKCIVYNS